MNSFYNDFTYPTKTNIVTTSNDAFIWIVLSVVIAIVGDVGTAGGELETVYVAPQVGGEIDIDGGGIVFETTQCHSILTEACTPVLVGHVVEVDKVGVVEECHCSWVGDDALFEIIAESSAEVTSKHEIEILAVETKVGGSVGGGILTVGTYLKLELVEYFSPLHLRVRRDGNKQHE